MCVMEPRTRYGFAVGLDINDAGAGALGLMHRAISEFKNVGFGIWCIGGRLYITQ